MSLIEFTGCNTCTLKHEWKWLKSPRMPLCLPELPSDIRILIIGEGPGGDEDDKGRQFVGKTGRHLRERLPGDWEKRVFWQNVVRCRPPKNRTPTTTEVLCCSNFLEEDIERVKPHAILGLGDVALNYFWPDQHITGIRGVYFPVALNNSTTWFFSTFHPSHVSRSTRKQGEKEVNTIDPIFKSDLRRFFADLDKIRTPPVIQTPPTILYPKTKEEAFNLFDRLEEPFGLDIETFKKKPYIRDARLLTSAFSDGELTFALPVQWPGMINTWGLDFFIAVMSRKKRWIAHGAGMELPWVWYLTKDHEQYFDDTIALGRLFHHRRGILSLGEQTRIHLGVDVKEITGVKATNSMDYIMHRQKEFLDYNALDAWGCAKLKRTIKIGPEQELNYIRILRTIKSGVAMELLGLEVDLAESEKLSKELDKSFIEFTEESRTLPEVQAYERDTGRKFSISSPEVVGEVLVTYCGLKLPKLKKQYSTDESDLQEYADTNQLVRNTLNFREVAKLKSTYVDPILFGKIIGIDGLLHPAYKALGTITGRTSSEDPNFQNFPKRKHREIRRQIVAPPGFIFLSNDYGQLEARVIAMDSKDPVLMKSIINKDDIHGHWLGKVIKRYPAYMDRLREKTGEKVEKMMLKVGRDIIKTDFVFASFYGSMEDAVSSRTMIPLEIAKELLDEFWSPSYYKKTKEYIQGQFQYYEDEGSVKTMTNFIRNENLPGNEPINNRIQGTAGHIVLESQNALFDEGMRVDPFLMPRWNIHDDLGFIVPDDNDLERYIKTTAGEMAEPRFDFINVPLMVECKIGYNFCDLEEVTKIEGAYFS